MTRKYPESWGERLPAIIDEIEAKVDAKLSKLRDLEQLIRIVKDSLYDYTKQHRFDEEQTAETLLTIEARLAIIEKQLAIDTIEQIEWTEKKYKKCKACNGEGAIYK